MDNDNINIVETDPGAKDGQTKCPKCGATDISLNQKTGKLRCNFCRHEFEPEVVEQQQDLSQMVGETHGSGARDIDEDFDNIITLKCQSCGAEVVIDTSETTNARCHWCRNTLSVNTRIPNGAVPDVVLPFKVPKKDAEDSIATFVHKRRFFAHPQFKKEFSLENMHGVYLPYMVIDENTHVSLSGQGEHQTREYTVGSGDNETTRYDADLYDVARDFDLTVNNLTIESSADKLENSKTKTNNIINSIMPFDTENAVKWDANYLKGYSSEKRDVNVSDLKERVVKQTQDIARHRANETIKFYDRGVRWDRENLQIKGQDWKAAYLPVWLYSYQQKKSGGKSLLHYVAVNARTKETMGSVPIHMPKLIVSSIIAELVGIAMTVLSYIFLMGSKGSDKKDWPLIFLSLGIIFFAVIYARYRNAGARHHYESETKSDMTNVQTYDSFVKHEKGLSNSRMANANNNAIYGSNKASPILSNKLQGALQRQVIDKR